ncbi:MAG: isoquinoline 1-oxidoreductase, partial [Sphingomonas bacterium]|nr:isoquinoline 1-oxidoreductase [Sphingomonas bacterium]
MRWLSLRPRNGLFHLRYHPVPFALSLSKGVPQAQRLQPVLRQALREREGGAFEWKGTRLPEAPPLAYQAGMTAGITRRRLLIGGGAGVGLVVAWGLWPRVHAPNVAAAPGETILGPFLKIGEDGHVTIVVPQAETGQGAWTALPQILTDELGADWRTVAVEPAPVGPLYANHLLADELAADVLPVGLRAIGGWDVDRWATSHDFAMTALSTSVRAFEAPLRAAGATARALLCMAAAEHWDADWRACDTQAGFVVRGTDRLRFGDLAARAAVLTPPKEPPLRKIGAGGISGQPLPRLDAPAKLDGSVRFAADVRLPDMVFCAIREAPPGDSRLARIDRAAAKAIPDLVAVFDNPGWVAAAGVTWWAANRALDALAPRFETRGGLPDSASIDVALGEALATDAPPATLHADYSAGLAAHAALETRAATARIVEDRLELWIGTQAPAAVRSAAARAIGFSDDRVTLYPLPLGGGFGAGLETRTAEQAAILALKLKRPVQLMASRVEDMLHDRFRPPARARMSGTVAIGGTIAEWNARIAAPAALRETMRALLPGVPMAHGPEPLAGATPPYAIPKVTIEHVPVDIGLPTGVLRGEAAGYGAFFTECFVDELAGKAGIDPLSFRIDMLGDNPRLAKCLSTAAMLGGWEGGAQGSAQGLAAFMAYGSFIAMMAQVRVGADQRIVVDRIAVAVDCGRMINPDLVRQQIEGGVLFALPAAIGPMLTVTAGLSDRRRIGALGLPRLADAPEIRIELIQSDAAPGGVSGLAVPPVAAASALP